MTASLPSHHYREVPDVLAAAIAIALLLSPFLLKLHIDLHRNRVLADEFQSARASILTRIEAASANDDLETLTRIQNRYASSVADPDFRNSLDHALARVTSREAEFKLTISRLLDLSRQRQKSPVTFTQAAVPAPDQLLSKLPR